ncbi:hypothetical protein, partial [Zavarzinella formosa]|uniref:hypothetical protein n=1 Tax=Zavarzinella formosa TaxID=360055 RepID=UPI00187D82EC
VTSGGSTQVQFKKKSATAWQEAPPPIGDSLDTFVTGVDDGADYDLRARFRNAIGVRSDWTQISHTVIGKT